MDSRWLGLTATLYYHKKLFDLCHKQLKCPLAVNWFANHGKTRQNRLRPALKNCMNPLRLLLDILLFQYKWWIAFGFLAAFPWKMPQIADSECSSEFARVLSLVNSCKVIMAGTTIAYFQVFRGSTTNVVFVFIFWPPYFWKIQQNNDCQKFWVCILCFLLAARMLSKRRKCRLRLVFCGSTTKQQQST